MRSPVIADPVKNRIVVVVGCGNAGHALAGEMAARGARVRMLELTAPNEALANLQESLSVIVEETNGNSAQYQIESAGDDAQELLDGADFVLVAVPAFAHRSVAEKTAAYIPAKALMVLFTAGLGSQEWLAALLGQGRDLDYPIVETSTLPYAARLAGPSTVRMILRLQYFSAAAFPGSRRPDAEKRFTGLFPQARFSRTILEPCLRNVNGVIHPPVVLLNASRVEDRNATSWKIWQTGVTPAIAGIIEQVDAERLAIAKSFGLDLSPIAIEQSDMGYGRRGSILETLTTASVLAEIDGPTSMKHRFLTEDVPYFLAMLIDLARLAGVPCETMTAIARLAGAIHSCDWLAEGRNLRSLGLAPSGPASLLAHLGDSPT